MPKMSNAVKGIIVAGVVSLNFLWLLDTRARLTKCENTLRLKAEGEQITQETES